ncbi:MAG: 2Fe-2S iron-sulfur cluster-binding protein [Solimonas sp.]
MPKVNYIEANGASHLIEVPVDESVMRGALYNDVPGIVGECGGACSCATCRCYVDDAWVAKVGGPTSDAERDLLEGIDETGPNARLSCQITMTPELDGLVVRLPEKQY